MIMVNAVNSVLQNLIVMALFINITGISIPRNSKSDIQPTQGSIFVTICEPELTDAGISPARTSNNSCSPLHPDPRDPILLA
ncbi:MAG: hypothetical protein Ct9H300mP4_13670 [Gammaproteobacteria bacterium]|nr:MAG: hypothetical protein Ct9H300mP4_13670 [Gammaproteobacteria bacterium]